MNRRKQTLRKIEQNVKQTLCEIKFDVFFYKILASTMYWAEGGKEKSFLAFVNSDPAMIKSYLKALRKGFKLDESKFRCLIHIHEYHNEEMIKNFWSNITDIPLSQFSKSYLKPHTSKRVHNDYKGCIRIRYYDSMIAAEIRMIYNMLPKRMGVW